MRNVSEINKSFAEFLEANPFKEFVNADIYSYEMYGVIDSIEDGVAEKHFFLPEEMPFNSDWNWIMTVLDKVEGIEDVETYSVIISRNRCKIIIIDENSPYPDELIIEAIGDYTIDAVYSALSSLMEHIRISNNNESYTLIN